MNRANYSAEQRDLIRQCHAKRDEWLQLCASAPWQVAEENKKDGFVISQCTSSHQLPTMKTTGVLPYPLMQVFACLHDSNYRPIYDSNNETNECLKKVAANTYMIY